MRPDDHHCIDIGRDCRLIEKVQLLKLDVFILDKRLQQRDWARGRRKRRLLVTRDVSQGLLFPFDKIDHRARDRLLAFECGDPRAFAERHPALVNIGHLRCLHCFVAPIVVEHQEAFIGDDLVFIEQLLGPGKIPLRIDLLDVDLSFPGVLIFGQQILNVRGDRRARRKENRDAHLALERVKETLRLV